MLKTVIYLTTKHRNLKFNYKCSSDTLKFSSFIIEYKKMFYECRTRFFSSTFHHICIRFFVCILYFSVNRAVTNQIALNLLYFFVYVRKDCIYSKIYVSGKLNHVYEFIFSFVLFFKLTYYTFTVKHL